MRRFVAIFVIVLMPACAGSSALDEAQARAMYVQAVNLRLEGDQHASRNLLFELAQRAPDTRVGMKARVALQTGDPLLGGVAMAGILSAIAVPNFIRYQLRAKTAEARANLGGIRVVQEAVRAEHGRYLPADPSGVEAPSSDKQPWTVKPCSDNCSPKRGRSCTSFACLGFVPDGSVYYAYACNVTGDGQNYTCAALGDLDDDGVMSLFVYGTGTERLVAPIPAFGEDTPSCPNATPGVVFDCTPGEF